MAIRGLLAQHLARLIRENGQPKAQLAKQLGYTRQRLWQLENADRSALPEAIEEAINRMGYEVDGVNVKPVTPAPQAGAEAKGGEE